jgi:hypothetical protein
MSNLALNDLSEGVYLPFSVPASAASRPFALAGGFLIGGWSLIETTGAASATLELIDGDANGGTSIAVISLAAGACQCFPAPGRGLEVRSGLWLSAVAGSVRGSIWVQDVKPAAS